ncbi:DUF1501 domain-containing protein [Elongatibacter sediminis]|uniref:DUF1501 domain-containing protein n=1 Tax=Elongatibacter sediminis TaxID=3119006 RepID=A0AAW9RDQ6_9GAMM
MGATVPLRAWSQDCAIAEMPRTLVNVMLQGGADLRFLFMPAPGHPDPVYTGLIWQARRVLYDSEYPDYETLFENEYLPAQDNRTGLQFGIHRDAEWLWRQFGEGRVAVVCNAYCSRNRRHDQSILNADAGEPELEVLNFDRNGWGGRLVEYLGPHVNSVELGDSVSTFNKGSVPGARLDQVVHAEDMRDMALAAGSVENPASARSVLARALSSWYDVRSQETRSEQPADWPWHAFYRHYESLRDFGGRVEERLSQCQPLAESLQSMQLASSGFAQQCRNLYDLCQVPDVLQVGAVSMNYGGWDTHDGEAGEIRRNLSDLFASSGGLATTTAAIEELPYRDVSPASQLVFYFASDFGRQLVANGTAGTDHGRGTYSVLIGQQVRGGVYGEMFPQREAAPDADGRIPLQTPGADIEGQTSTDRLLATAADWVSPGAGAVVFPAASGSGLEPGVDVGTLLADA